MVTDEQLKEKLMAMPSIVQTMRRVEAKGKVWCLVELRCTQWLPEEYVKKVMQFNVEREKEDIKENIQEPEKKKTFFS